MQGRFGRWRSGGGGGGSRGQYRGGGGGGRGRDRRDFDDEGRSPQSSSCFDFMKPKKRYVVSSGPQGQRTVAARLGLPVRGGRARGGLRPRMQQSRQQSGPSWYKIVIPWGRQHGKEFILESLGGYVDGDLCPVLFKIQDTGEAIFFLEDRDEAESVEAANRRIQGPNGKQLIIKKYSAPPPFVPCPKDEIELIKTVLGSRYDATNGHLNLSAFGLDPVFKQNEKHCTLQRNNVMMAVSKLIGENCPDVHSIDFSNNRLRYLDYTGALLYRAKHVQRISLAKNQIDTMAELEKLKGWPVVEIELDQNPLCNKFREKNSFISAVHNVFPKVRLLDGVAVQPEIGFALEDEIYAPRSQRKQMPKFSPGFYVNEHIRKLVETFVLEYFTLYDGQNPAESRQGLFQAYEQDATFTLVLEIIDPQGRYADKEVFLEYRRDSHNIKQLDRWERYRHKLVNKGAINVLAKLIKLPRTQHIMDSFLVDDKVMCFSVQGLFRDGEDAGTESKEIKFFNRSFLVIPKDGDKIAVVNDAMLITPFSQDQVERYTKMLQKAVAPEAAAVTSVSSQPQPPLAVVPAAPESHESLTARFAAESGMKKTWAEKCLEDNDWSFEAAAQVFVQMKEQGVIPAEAFE